MLTKNSRYKIELDLKLGLKKHLNESERTSLHQYESDNEQKNDEILCVDHILL